MTSKNKHCFWIATICTALFLISSANSAHARHNHGHNWQDWKHQIELWRKGWRPIWRDEFNGSEINSNYWSHEVNCWGGGNNEQQCYTADDDNSFVQDGYLHIVSREDPTSGPALVDDDPNYDPNDMSVTLPHSSARLRTKDKFDFKYGRVEVRAKVADGQGMWPAIWMLPTDYVYGGWPSSGEIDIFESFNPGPDNTHVAGTLHYGLKWPQWKLNGADYVLDASPAEDFHVYAIEWEADEIRFYVDGNHYMTQTSDGWYNYIWKNQKRGFQVANPRAPFDQNFHMILNQAVGGDPVGPVTPGWGEREMLIDYVRVYQCKRPRPRSRGGNPEGTGCATVDPAVQVSEDAGSPGKNNYKIFKDGPKTLSLEHDGQTVENTVVPGFWEEVDGTLFENQIDIGGRRGVVWDVMFNGTGNVFLTAQDMENDPVFDTGVQLVGGSGWTINGEIEFKMLVNSASDDSVFTVKLDSGWPNQGQKVIETPTIGKWQNVKVSIADLIANPNPAGGGVDLTNILNLFVLEYTGTSAHVQIDNIKLQCAFNTTPEVWQLDQVCDMTPRVATVTPGGDAHDVYVDSVTDWEPGVCCGGGAAISEPNLNGNNVLQFDYDGDPGTNTVTFFGLTAPRDLSNFIGGTLEFDMYVTTQPNNPAADPWLIKVDCTTGCTTGDTPIQESNEGVLPPTGEWQHYTFNVSDLISRGLNMSQVSAVVIFPAWGNQDNASYQLDNVQWKAGSGAAEPTVAAPTPTVPASEVISLFSDAYTNIAPIDYNPNWSQATVTTQVDIAGNNTLKYANLNYQGTDFAGAPQDVTGMNSFHLDYWTGDSTSLNVYLISPGPIETAYSLPITPNTWMSIDIPLSEFAPVDLSNVFQIKFDGNGTIFLDNLYFSTVDGSGGGGTEPTTAAPTPTVPAADVISVFSDAYTNISPIDYNPNWSQATVTTQVDVAGNNTLKYENLNYQGTDFSGAIQDVSGMDSFHLDFWTADSTALNVYLISPGPSETSYALPITPNTWVSVDIPLSAFSSVVDLMNVMQIKFDGNGTVFLDNMYFSKASSGGGSGDNLATNGDFEAGDLSGWTLFENGGVIAIDTTQANGGTHSGKLTAGQNHSPLMKQANVGVGEVVTGDMVTIEFDLYGSLAGAGGVVFAEFFSEKSGGGTSSAEILSGGPIFPTDTWTTYSYTATAGPDVSGGITLQLKAACGDVPGCQVDAYFDNVSIMINP